MNEHGCEPDHGPTDDALRLALVSGIGPRSRQNLLEHFGSAEAVFAATNEQLGQVAGIGPKLSRRLERAREEIDVADERRICRENHVAILADDATDYPRLLREISDPPGVLFVRGGLRAEDGLAVGIVGTRHASRYGLAQAERLAAGLSHAGLTIVSGLARGVDAAAHRGALRAGGRTVAVLGSGVLNIYPPEHVELAAEVAASGAVISEAPPRRPPQSGAFPQRNRLISGLSLGILVIEAGDRSGALISARHALDQGREVFAVPGRIDSRTSRGCHQLIRDGAKLVEHIDDVLDELGPLVERVTLPGRGTVHQPAELRLNDQEQIVLQAIDADPLPVDEVIRRSGLPVQRVLATLSVLEVRRLVQRCEGGLVVRR